MDNRPINYFQAITIKTFSFVLIFEAFMKSLFGIIVMKKKILVTGGAGYIGSHTCVALQEQGCEVIIVDNLSNSNKKVVDRIKMITGQAPLFYKVDVCNKNGLADVFKKHPGIFGVIHFAALKAVGESTRVPLLYYHNNISGLTTLLQAMEKYGCANLVFSSSATVYGQPDNLPVSEDAPLQKAASPYGNTKRISEEIISDQVACGKLNAVSLRYFNPIGAHPSALIGELPLGVPNNLVPFLTQTVAGKRPEVKVFGNDYNTPDGTGVRDYIHVVDLAEAHVSALSYLENGLTDENPAIFNLGTGNGYSVLEIIKTFEKVNGLKVSYTVVDRRPGDVDKVWADCQKANIVLGWKARLGIDDMLKSAWEWEKTLAVKN